MGIESQKGVRWLRVSYLTGAIADGVVAIGMFSQAIFVRASPHTGGIPDAPYRYAIAVAGSLMLGWTLLLLWADRRPVERRGVLQLTIVAILGLAASEVLAVVIGLVPLARAAWVFCILAGLMVLFSLSLWMSRTRS